MSAAPRIWPQADGSPVSCRDKLEILAENYEEMRHVLQDAFEDALLMGVDEAFMREILLELASSVKSPRS